MGIREWRVGRRRCVASEGEEKRRRTIGCMSGMLHYLDFHHLLFHGNLVSCAGPPYPGGDEPAVRREELVLRSKGVEAPRNSLELDEKKGSSAAFLDDDDFFGIPIGIQLPAPPLPIPNLVGSPAESTPRTPNLVARLMGFDGLPATAMPSPVRGTPRNSTERKEVTKHHEEMPSPPLRRPLKNVDFNRAAALLETGSFSLPVSPRASTSGKPSLEAGRRLSLQINKENSYSRSPAQLYENAEFISVPVPLTKFREKGRSCRMHHDENRGHESVNQVKGDGFSKKTRAGSGEVTARKSFGRHGEVKTPTEITSPPSDKLFKLPRSKSDNHHQSRLFSSLLPNHRSPGVKSSRLTPTGKCKVVVDRHFVEQTERPPPVRASRPAARPKKLSTKKSFPKLKIVEVEERRNIGSNRPHGGHHHRRQQPEKHPEYWYIEAVLDYAGFSPSLSIDPLVFHRLELDLPLDIELAGGLLQHRWNRKLLFHLTEEILADIKSIDGAASVAASAVWQRIQNLPTLQSDDVDALVEADMPTMSIRRLLHHPKFSDEATAVVTVLVRRILDGLVGEAAMALFSRYDVR